MLEVELDTEELDMVLKYQENLILTLRRPLKSSLAKWAEVTQAKAAAVAAALLFGIPTLKRFRSSQREGAAGHPTPIRLQPFRATFMDRWERHNILPSRETAGIMEPQPVGRVEAGAVGTQLEVHNQEIRVVITVMAAGECLVLMAMEGNSTPMIIPKGAVSVVVVEAGTMQAVEAVAIPGGMVVPIAILGRMPVAVVPTSLMML